MSYPPEPPSNGVAADVTPDQPSGPWAWYRRSPRWLQILIPVVVLAIVAAAVWALGESESDDAVTSGTTEVADTQLEVVLKGLILVGGAAALVPSETTAAVGSTAASNDVPETSDTPQTSEAAASTSPATSEAAVVTDVPVSTDVPATAPANTEAPATTDAPVDTSDTVPTTSPQPGLPTPSEFITTWNDTATGTSVPTITAEQAMELTGSYAGHYLITLSPQVGLVGTLTASGSGRLAQLLLVWIPGADDDDSSDFYWESFAVLVQAVSPGTTTEDTATLERNLGRAPGQPPFTSPGSATSGGLEYRSFDDQYEGTDETVEFSAISVE